MSIIKQISVFDGSSWNTDNIGANAGNIDLMNAEGTATSTIAGSTNLLTGLNNILPASKLTASRVLVSNSSGVITTSSITSTQLGRLSDVSDNVQTQINTLNTNLNTKIDLTPQTLVMSTFSSSYSFARRFAFLIGKIVIFSAEVTLPTLTASANLFTIYKTDGTNLVPHYDINEINTRMWNFYIMSYSTHEGYIGSFQYHQNSGRYYVNTRQALAAGTYGISGCYVID